MYWTLEKISIIKRFLDEAEQRWPLTIERNRDAAREWVALCREFDNEYADRLEKIIKSYEAARQ
jgi:hypothetical protein